MFCTLKHKKRLDKNIKAPQKSVQMIYALLRSFCLEIYQIILF